METITFKVTQKEKRRLKREARLRRVSLSEYVRIATAPMPQGITINLAQPLDPASSAEETR